MQRRPSEEPSRNGMPAPRLLVTGFGPFPGAPRNPTEALMHDLSGEAPEAFGAVALKVVVLPTEYRRSWEALRRLYAGFAPDVVVHFGLSHKIKAIHVERMARIAADPARRDAAGYAPQSARARRSGPDTLHATLPVSAIVAALTDAGVPAASSDDAGAYVCNATLYRSLSVNTALQRRVGFIHVPPLGRGGLDRAKAMQAARIALRVAVTAEGDNSGAWLSPSAATSGRMD